MAMIQLHHVNIWWTLV